MHTVPAPVSVESPNMSPITAHSDEYPRLIPEALVLPVTIEETNEILAVDEYREIDIEVMLDSGCCKHVMDAEDAPGYTVMPSAGSRRGQNFIVGNGQRIPNEGEVHLSLLAPAGGDEQTPVQSVFQIAEITRPLMSVSQICDQGYACVFTKDGAEVMDDDRNIVARFERSNGLYVASMRLRPPEPFTRPVP